MTYAQGMSRADDGGGLYRSGELHRYAGLTTHVLSSWQVP